ncbi:unnamed protein product [Arctogadus glacialis]
MSLSALLVGTEESAPPRDVARAPSLRQRLGRPPPLYPSDPVHLSSPLLPVRHSPPVLAWPSVPLQGGECWLKGLQRSESWVSYRSPSPWQTGRQQVLASRPKVRLLANREVMEEQVEVEMVEVEATVRRSTGPTVRGI